MPKEIYTNFNFDEEIKKCKTINYIMSKNGLIQKLVTDVLENILENEMEVHLGRYTYELIYSDYDINNNYRTGIVVRI